ncbi:hypothetical protein [Actinomadura sp. 3N407]|uniref:hypothetical protein n=1 Tax=Actinomadura sp. 3N407 TaxID=3457423 RepID=UPI003FCED171
MSLQAGARWWTGFVSVSPPFLHGTVTAYGTTDEVPVEGSFALESAISREIARVQRLPGGDLLNPVVKAKGRVDLRFDEFRLRGAIDGRRCRKTEVRRHGHVQRGMLECAELLDRLGELTRAVSLELHRLGEHDPRDALEKALRSWRIARLRLGIGERQPGSDKANDGTRILRNALDGEPLTDPRLRELAEELIGRLETIEHPTRAGRIRDLLGDLAR